MYLIFQAPFQSNTAKYTILTHLYT